MAFYKVWYRYAEVAEEARRIARERETLVTVRRLAMGWDLPDYPSWDRTADIDQQLCDEEAYWGASGSSGLAPPDWEDGSPDEVRVARYGAYVYSWDAD